MLLKLEFPYLNYFLILYLYFLAENDVIHAFGVLRINSFGIDTKMGFEVNKKAILDYKMLLKLEFPYLNIFLIFDFFLQKMT